ncbi:acid-sensing ion channel 3-like [Amphiura filiformis]|uniref:acid-sensing ion channel 3-like n=1 Tax=Amphiura filiformis TaxID=82378 RepID=UPI003B21D9DE
MSTLSSSQYYNGWRKVFSRGLGELNLLFPQLGLTDSDKKTSNSLLFGDSFPGFQNLYEFVENAAHSIDSMIVLCSYNGEKCGAENFTTTLTNQGLCYTFNSIANPEKLLVKTPGRAQGLTLILNAEEHEVVAAPRENIGFKMLAHPRGEFPNLEDNGIELATGMHVPIRLKVTDVKTLSSPYGNCGTKPLKYFTTEYTASKCYLECETDYLVSQCGCRNFYMPGNASYCSPLELLSCLYPQNPSKDACDYMHLTVTVQFWTDSTDNQECILDVQDARLGV